MSKQQSLISLEEVSHRYGNLSNTEPTLRDISLSFRAGQTCSIVGSSGSGKSTLLNILGLLDTPTSGRVKLAGTDMSLVPIEARATARNRLIGFVFQSFNLLPRINVLDNVALPLLYRGLPRKQCRLLAQAELDRVGLTDRANHRPADLSGGQRQRVSIARALVGDPALLLADEPTGNLDRHNAREIIRLMMALNQERETTLIVVTHDINLAHQFERSIKIAGGRATELV